MLMIAAGWSGPAALQELFFAAWNACGAVLGERGAATCALSYALGYSHSYTQDTQYLVRN